MVGKGNTNNKSVIFEVIMYLCETLNKVSKNNELSLYIILVTVLKCLIYRYENNNDIMVGSSIYINIISNKENYVVVLRYNIDNEMTFKECLISVKIVIEAYENQNYL